MITFIKYAWHFLTKVAHTVMIVPHDQQRMHTFKISAAGIYLLFIIFVGCFSWSIFIITKHVDYESTRKASKILREKKKLFAVDMEKGTVSLQRIAVLENYLRGILKRADVKTKRAIIEYSGQGGPTENDQVKLRRILENKADISQEELSQQLEKISKVVDEREKSINEFTATLACIPFGWPTKGWITSNYGERVSPLSGEAGERHMGIDVANAVGTPIHATAEGIVTFVGKEGGYGKLVVIQHNFGYATRYGHNSLIKAKVGEKVKRGDILSYMGATGNATGSHCHYEIRRYGVPVNPFSSQYGCIY